MEIARIPAQEKTASDMVSNTGLGLPIAKQIVEMHGGEIWATSYPGAGTCMSFILPQGLKKEKKDNGAGGLDKALIPEIGQIQ